MSVLSELTRFAVRPVAQTDAVAAGGAGPLVGRVLLATIFILSGMAKVANLEQTSLQMEQAGISSVPFFLGLAILVEIVAGLSVFTGTFARFGALVLLLFLFPVTLTFHDFWAFQGADMQMQLVQFLKNLAIMGGLLYVFLFGPGTMSVDAILARKTR